MKHLIIIGVGGFGREVYWNAQNSIGFGTNWDLKGFLDGDVKLPEDEYKKLVIPLLGDINNYQIQINDVFVCAIGNCKTRERVQRFMEDKGAEFINIIHDTCIIHGTAKLGKGVILAPGVIIGDNATLNDGVFLNTRSGVGHDAVIGSFSSFMSACDITGYVQIGERSYWGSGSRCVPHAKIGDDTVIGIASVVLRRVKIGQKVFGIPAVPYE